VDISEVMHGITNNLGVYHNTIAGSPHGKRIIIFLKNNVRPSKTEIFSIFIFWKNINKNDLK